MTAGSLSCAQWDFSPGPIVLVPTSARTQGCADEDGRLAGQVLGPGHRTGGARAAHREAARRCHRPPAPEPSDQGNGEGLLSQPPGPRGEQGGQVWGGLCVSAAGPAARTGQRVGAGTAVLWAAFTQFV